MFNRPTLLMNSLSAAPQACFSLRIPYLYNDRDYCGDPKNTPGHENGSGSPGPCGGCFNLELLDADGETIAALKNKDRYDADPYEMFYGTWGDFYGSARSFYEPLSLVNPAKRNTPIRTIRFNFCFFDGEFATMLSRRPLAADRIGSMRMLLETTTNTYQVMRDSAIYCYYYIFGTQSGDEIGGLTISNMNGEQMDVNVSIPETLTIYYKDVRQISAAVTSGLVMWMYPPDIGDIV